MIRRKLTALIMCIMSLNLVACSNIDNTQISKEQIDENTVSSEINKEKELFDKAVIIADDDIARVKITGKEKVTPGNSIGYIFSISNKSNKKIAFYMKNITINGNEQKTSLDENFKMTLEPITDFSTQLKVLNIESLDELKNAKGTFRIEVNDNVNEYKFEIE
ncbi:hypothetical protein [Romboutsia ilealis]|uniref:hypothetical protein n=1 Tax=Romboutsia ilealis TaxID=1115758 RepID=UPI002494F404|nr:hypothetical protein [Romboutsia ilealis]